MWSYADLALAYEGFVGLRASPALTLVFPPAPKARPNRSSMLRVVFVCSGNICRSPIAHVLFDQQARAASLRAVTVSMSTLGLVGRDADPHAVAVCATRGADLSFHRSQPVNVALLQRATHIFVMEDAHRAHLRSLGVDADRILFLGAFDPVDARREIEDPVGKDIATFEACAIRIERAIAAFIESQR